MNWDVYVLVMIKIVTPTKFVRLVTETGQICVTEMSTEIGFRVAFIYQRICFVSHIAYMMSHYNHGHYYSVVRKMVRLFHGQCVMDQITG